MDCAMWAEVVEVRVEAVGLRGREVGPERPAGQTPDREFQCCSQ